MLFVLLQGLVSARPYLEIMADITGGEPLFVELPKEFKSDGGQYDVVLRSNKILNVKQAGLALPNPTLSAPENWTASCIVTIHVVANI